mmetsp:Transcript_27297/g.43845  ORF Transcript_27297/g.43845 Transcript_27297/m.43845 type:complete len:108 (-) Transcript_27297:998-1321(-)
MLNKFVASSTKKASNNKKGEVVIFFLKFSCILIFCISTNKDSSVINSQELEALHIEQSFGSEYLLNSCASFTLLLHLMFEQENIPKINLGSGCNILTIFPMVHINRP